MSKKKIKTLLISAPFFIRSYPPAGIGRLKSVLQEKGYEVSVHNLSLYLAAHLGEEVYDKLSNDFLASEGLYSLCLFPSRKRKAAIASLFARWVKLFRNDPIPDSHCSLEYMLRKIRTFNESALKKLHAERYDVVGFTLVANQILPSLFFSKMYKKRYPLSKIVFGGPQCIGDIGRSYLKSFPWVDHVVHGEGETTFLALLEEIASKTPEVVPGCSSRINGSVLTGPNRNPISDLDKLPDPDYSDYIRDIERCNFRNTTTYLPIEMSRGCWWGKCTFCNVKCLYTGYRRFSPRRILKTVESLSSKLSQLNFFCVDLIHYQPISKLVSSLRCSKKDLSFFMEARATITCSELAALNSVGITTALFGIESFSTSLLNKMGKGTTALQNIRSLIHAKELGIQTAFNLIPGFPGETKNEFDETLNNLKCCWHLTPNLRESPFSVLYGSPVFLHPRHFGIIDVFPDPLYKLLFPPKHLRNLKVHFYGYSSKRGPRGSYLAALSSERFPGSAYPFLEAHDGHDFLLIRDGRFNDAQVEFCMHEPVRSIYLYCRNIRDINDICRTFSSLNKDDILKQLRSLCRKKLMVSENNAYLSLATFPVAHGKYRGSASSNNLGL